MSARLILILLLSLRCICSSAGEPYLKHYTIDDGPPGSMIYKLVQDKDGFIWLYTNSGVSQFNGFDFRNYNLSNGFPAHAAFTGVLDENGRLWFITMNDSACYYENHKFRRFATSYNVSWVLSDTSGLYFLTTAGHILWYKNYKLYKDIRACSNKLYHGVVLGPGSLIVHSTAEGLIKVDNNIVHKMKNLDNGQLFTRFFKLRNGDVLLSNGSGIFEVNGTDCTPLYLFKNKHDLSYEIFDILDNGRELWICATSGLYVCKNKNDITNAVRLYDNNLVTAIIYDIDSNLWFGTRNDGLYSFRQNISANMIFKNPMNCYAEYMYKGSSPNSIYIFYGNNEVKNLQLLPQPHIETIHRFKTTIRRVYPLLNSYFVDCLDGIYEFPGNKIYPGCVQFYYKGYDSTLYTGSDSGFIRIWKDGRTKLVLPNFSRDSEALYVKRYGTLILRVVAAKNDTFWVGNERGLHTFTPGGIDKPFTQEIAQAYVADIKIDREGIVWVATKGRGVYYIKSNRLYIPGCRALENATCNMISIDDEDNVWVATQDGLFKIVKSNNCTDVVNYNYRNILPTAEIKCVFKSGKYVLVSTSKGVNIFEDIPDAWQLPGLKALISGIYVNNTSVIDRTNMTFSPKQNNIRFEYTALDFSSVRRPVYYYCLKGQDSMWVRTSQPSIDFNYLQPGEYTFYVKAENMRGIMSSSAASLSFVIRPPFWQTYWFYTLVVLVASVVAFFLINYNRRVHAKKRAFIETELKALRAQMNPHFIFNTLNAIQDFILQNDKSKANYYLVQFSRLMRIMLENSKKNYISLEREIRFLELYLELEAFRFNDKFHYLMSVGGNIDRSGTFIPSMILQPFIENAINHGIMPKKTGGHISISIELQNKDLLKCTIEDDGVGRKEAAHDKPYESAGILTTESRLRLLNKNSTDTIVFTDLVNEQGEPSGTRVEIWINIQAKNNT